MTFLQNYLNDGAGYQSRAVLCFLQNRTFEESWNTEKKCYDAEPTIARWENCREQGYVISLYTKDYNKTFHIAFFEHRNSDEICAVKWEQSGLINSPNIDTAKFGDVYKDKYDVSHRVPYGKVIEMADWIYEELSKCWKDNS